MFPDQFQRRVGADLGDGFEVVASEKDTEVNELSHSKSSAGGS